MQTEYQALIEALMGRDGSAPYIPHIDGTREWLGDAARVSHDKNRLSRIDRYKFGQLGTR